MKQPDAGDIKQSVKELYSKLAGQQSPCCAPPSEETSTCSCSQSGRTTRSQALYSKEELDSILLDIPSLGCGNPIALSGLQPGETVLDLGSGGGLDCFLAARQVGSKGKVIGLDMTPDMIRLARANAEKMSAANVEFRLGEMEHMPVDSDSVDVVISNCVINLSPDKDAVFREICRVLKPGGRLCVSDIVTRGELPQAIRDSLEQWAGCVAGALTEQDYLQKIRDAGFTQLTSEDVNLAPDKERAALETGAPIASISVKAYKPK
jgi:SAM-dependent methyltransferase